MRNSPPWAVPTHPNLRRAWDSNPQELALNDFQDRPVTSYRSPPPSSVRRLLSRLGACGVRRSASITGNTDGDDLVPVRHSPTEPTVRVRSGFSKS